MTEYAKAVPGTFCWVELGTNDTDAARKFYTSLFGWSLSDMPMPGGASYGIAQVAAGKNVGGITRLPDEAKKMGARPNWMSYVAVEDADAAAKKVASLGGKVLMGPDETGPGKMAIAHDPTGAVFALWQEHQSMGTFLYQKPDATAKKIASLGGKAFGPLMDFPNVGRVGFFADPQGAAFAVIKATPPAKQFTPSRRQRSQSC